MTEAKHFGKKLLSELVSKGLMTEKEFTQYLQQSEQNTQSLVEILYACGKIPERELALMLSQIFGYPPINISTFVVDYSILALIPKEVALKYKILPVSLHEKTLTVAMTDPSNLSILDDIRAMSGMRIKPALAPPSELTRALKKYFESAKAFSAAGAESFDEIIQQIKTESKDAKSSTQKSSETSDLLESASATPIIKLVNHILAEAVRRKASDVFIEPWERTMRVRYRVDGMLEEILNAPRNFVGPVVSRVKVMSRLNIAEHRVPQDGRIKVRVYGREVDLRVSILPTNWGEKACLRVLDTGGQAQDLSQLGFSDRDLEIIRRTASRPHGMLLVTGPTGSGKTTTLYSVLAYLDSSEKNITTVEDPVEYQIKGINQVNVQEHVGLTFPAALRSILRQDPDIVLIGEIRDLTTMDIAIKAALTGHLVLSTLHTNDATSAIVRMVNMGIEPFLIASSVLMISAQRLVRKLCGSCRVAYTPEKELLHTLGLSKGTHQAFYRPKGCPQCRMTGFKGRTVVTELFEMKPDIVDLIVKGASAEELRHLARKGGMKTLRESGLEKIVQGVTSVEEVLRVTSSEISLQEIEVA